MKFHLEYRDPELYTGKGWSWRASSAKQGVFARSVDTFDTEEEARSNIALVKKAIGGNSRYAKVEGLDDAQA